ncbi:hypothetical protein DSM104635_01186 [Terricaulis silvestris]|uniref:Uncharacterized protein n=1 Tax=Terricaulis silvestris TaxID=2686094 RepID=A0A6I6MM26_9CAUL|nr:hypothetical protein DSM104635_01186 [Terricaulis silvestris]
MTGRRVFGVAWVVLTGANALLAFYAGKPGLTGLWVTLLVVALISVATDWNKPPEDVSAHPLRTQLVFGGVLLSAVALWWFARGAT